MKNFLVICIVLVSIAVGSVCASCDQPDEKKPLSDIVTKLTNSKEASDESDVQEFFKNVGCTIKKGATKVKEGAKKLGSEISEGAKKLSEKAKTFGSEVKAKLGEWKEKINSDSDEAKPHSLFANVEMIDPDILKAEQKCGHGHILDALGNCSKL